MVGSLMVVQTAMRWLIHVCKTLDTFLVKACVSAKFADTVQYLVRLTLSSTSVPRAWMSLVAATGGFGLISAACRAVEMPISLASSSETCWSVKVGFVALIQPN